MAASDVENAGSARTSPHRWYLWASAISLGALAIRVGYVLISKRHSGVPFNDAFYFHYQANLLAEGKGWFIDPVSYLFHHRIVQAADHPPLWTLVLALAAFVGLKSYLSQLLWACVVGTGAVFVTGMAARRVAGPAAGLVAAAVAAVYPNYWLNDGLGLSETLVLLIVAAIVLWSFRLWSEPSWGSAAVLGVLCALGALTRSELVLLLVFLLIPLGLVLRGVGMRRRLALVAVGILAALVTMAPWVGFNLSRFDRPELVSSELGVTLLCANNAFTYQGKLFGYWDGACTFHVKVSGDESDHDAQYRHLAYKYIKAHEGRVPLVVAARVGRELGLFNPWEQVHFDHKLEYRPLLPAEIGLFVYYALVVTAIAGAVALRRRRVTLVPFAGLPVEVVVASVLTYGTTRFRTPLEVGLVVLSSVLMTDLYASLRSRGVHPPLRARPAGVNGGAS
jgi:4-amino-4-deoxy-L-arabinose transferase-like glycosyltransferase